jgi:hypothetical protein
MILNVGETAAAWVQSKHQNYAVHFRQFFSLVLSGGGCVGFIGGYNSQKVIVFCKTIHMEFTKNLRNMYCQNTLRSATPFSTSTESTQNQIPGAYCSLSTESVKPYTYHDLVYLQMGFRKMSE